ncbi:hypothetical protein Cgig2_031174 [Carnegiea gigantea]|uniref:Uncharacterized protein n=1 Tax=Carnegiea gigantea TaxID=171969 RepID=A0A9Q1KRK8_9CARY|nr:hypothetical protein Cgig2_031174 [Carnegiea gigantea]
MAATARTSAATQNCNCSLLNLSRVTHHSSISRQFINYPLQSFSKGVRLGKLVSEQIKAVNGGKTLNTSPWDEKPFVILPNRKKVYLDEQDVVTILDPPKELTPFDPSYNPASYLWKKISDIPEERRHRLLYLLNPRLVKAAWWAAGGRYDDAKLAKLSSSSLLSGDSNTQTGDDNAVSLEFWNCRKSGGQMPVALIGGFKKALFHKDGRVYGRLIGESLLSRIATSFKPLYFTVKEVAQVMPTEEPCDLAYDFGNGLLDRHDIPEGFPKPEKHPWPFNDQVVIYIRHLGPGVMVGQAWQEGVALEQVPKKLCKEVLMVKDYFSASQGDQ